MNTAVAPGQQGMTITPRVIGLGSALELVKIVDFRNGGPSE